MDSFGPAFGVAGKAAGNIRHGRAGAQSLFQDCRRRRFASLVPITLRLRAPTVLDRPSPYPKSRRCNIGCSPGKGDWDGRADGYSERSGEHKRLELFFLLHHILLINVQCKSIGCASVAALCSWTLKQRGTGVLIDLSFNRYILEPPGVTPNTRGVKNFRDLGGDCSRTEWASGEIFYLRYMSADETDQNVGFGEKTKCSLTRHNKLP